MPAATGRLERAELPPTYTVIYRWRHFSSFSSVSVLHAIVTHVDPILGGTYPWAMSIFFNVRYIYAGMGAARDAMRSGTPTVGALSSTPGQ